MGREYLIAAAAVVFVGLFFIPRYVHNEVAASDRRHALDIRAGAVEEGKRRKESTRKPLVTRLGLAKKAVEDEHVAVKEDKSELIRAKRRVSAAEAELDSARTAFERSQEARYSRWLQVDSYTLEEVVETEAKAVFNVEGVEVWRVDPWKQGFGVALKMPATLSRSQQHTFLQGYSTFLERIDPAWISNLMFAKPGQPSVSLGPLSELSTQELTLFLQTFFGTRSGKLPPPAKSKPKQKQSGVVWRVKNDSSKVLRFNYYGPKRAEFDLQPREQKEVALVAGNYWVSVRVPDGSRVTPFTGSFRFEDGWRYSDSYYLSSEVKLPGGR